MISQLAISDRSRSILRGTLAVLVVAACYEATARSGLFPRALLPTLPKIAETLWAMILDGAMFRHVAMTLYRLLCGFWSLFLSPGRIRKVAIGVRPSTLLAFHQALVRRKYRGLFSSSQCPKTPGPKGPSDALIQAIVELKSRNPRFGCPRIARIISHTFGVDIDKNVVYRVLAKHYRPAPGGTGPSWLSFIGHTRDSLWSVDLFRCECP